MGGVAVVATLWHSPRMSTATAHLLSEFERLSADEQREFSAQVDYGDISDAELTASAASVFAIFDAEEDAQAR